MNDEQQKDQQPAEETQAAKTEPTPSEQVDHVLLTRLGMERNRRQLLLEQISDDQIDAILAVKDIPAAVRELADLVLTPKRKESTGGNAESDPGGTVEVSRTGDEAEGSGPPVEEPGAGDLATEDAL